MYSNQEYGPYLIHGINGTADKPATMVTSQYRSSAKFWSSSTVKRKRPVNPVRSPTSYAIEETSQTNTVVRGQYGNQLSIQVYGTASANVGLLNSDVTTAQNAAATKLRLRLKDQTWNAAQTAAELSKTLNFFTEAARDLYAMYRLAKRGDILGLSELYRRYDSRGGRRKPPFKRGASRWLQWRYAVMPLAYDLSDVLNEFTQSKVYPSVRRVTGTGTSTYHKYSEGLINNQRWARVDHGEVKVHYCTYYEVTPDLNEWKRLGFVNVPSLLYELTPLSFLFDWFIPVGTWLSGLDAEVGVTQIATTRSTKIEMRSEFHYAGGLSTDTVRSYGRTVGGVPSMPIPIPTLPAKGLSSKLLDALALFTQFRR